MSALRLTAAIKQRMLNYLQRLILILPFNPSRGDSFTSCMIPVETSTAPYFFESPARHTFRYAQCARQALLCGSVPAAGHMQVSFGTETSITQFDENVNSPYRRSPSMVCLIISSMISSLSCPLIYPNTLPFLSIINVVGREYAP